MDSNCLISRVRRCIVDADHFAVSRNTVRPFPVMELVAKTSTWKKVGLVIAALDELYLIVERNRDIEAFGEIRENIAYLTGLEPAKVRAAVIGLANMLDWSADPAAISPVGRRSLELVEYFAFAIVVPLALWLCGVFGAARSVDLS